MKILLTGAAGFIGFHLAKSILESGISLVGVDNLNPYYDTNLKKSRLDELRKYSSDKSFEFIKCDIANECELEKIFTRNNFDTVINLAAQADIS